MNELSLQTLEKEVIAIVEKAAAFISAQYGNIVTENIETKSLNSLVTYVDKTAEEILIDGLRRILPDAGFLTEENTVSFESKEDIWIIDPLDGTTNFIHSIPVFAISIALQRKGEIILGVVYEVNQKECFHAIKDGGAFLNGNAIHTSKRQQLSESLIATGFPYYDFSKLSNYQSLLGYFMQHTRGIRRLGAAAVDLCYVACGRFDGFFEYSLSPWDVAAGALIVKEAGGLVTDFKGTQDWLHGKEILASNNPLYKTIHKVIEAYFIQ